LAKATTPIARIPANALSRNKIRRGTSRHQFPMEARHDGADFSLQLGYDPWPN